MTETPRFRFSCVSSELTQCERNEFVLKYEDAHGKLYFHGFEPGHESGGMLYFPNPSDWPRLVKSRPDERARLYQRLIEYVRAEKHLRHLEKSISDPHFFDRWPRERTYLAMNCEPSSKAKISKMTPVASVVSATLHGGRAMVQFDRKFEIESVDGAVGGTIDVFLKSDRVRRQRTRLEMRFQKVTWQRDVPVSIDGLTVEDVTRTDIAAPEGVRSVFGKWDSHTLYRLRGLDGTDARILAEKCEYAEDDALPGAPSIFRAVQTSG